MTNAPLPSRWIHGSPSAKHDTDPEIQVFAFDETTFILRQNKSVHYEAPFLFVFIGSERALLVDTGATADERFFPLRRTVDELIGDRELLVIHTHAHADHVAGDVQFADRRRTVVVGTALGDVVRAFGLDRWPDGVGSVDLGQRVLDVIPSPGHADAAVSYYDGATGLLLSGDSVYPGRLYVRDMPAFATTIDRLVAFADEHPVSYVLGCHIEMTRDPRSDYPIRTTYQPNEPPLEMTVDQLRVLQEAVHGIADRPGVHVFDDFIVVNGIPDGYFGWSALLTGA